MQTDVFIKIQPFLIPNPLAKSSQIHTTPFKGTSTHK